jgi:hypothetical protein
LTVEDEIIAAVDRYLGVFRELDLGLPVFVAVSLTGVNGMQIPTGPRELPQIEETPIDRAVVHLPEVITEECGVQATRLMKPASDALWQAGGFARSRFYDADGNRIQRQ